jgi:hypothetical protein
MPVKRAYHSGGTQRLVQPLLRLCKFSLCNNSLGRLAHDAEKASDFTRLVLNRGVRDVEVNVLRVAVPLDVEGAVLGEVSPTRCARCT